VRKALLDWPEAQEELSEAQVLRAERQEASEELSASQESLAVQSALVRAQAEA